MTLANPKAALDRFLADNPELEQLSAQLATFNVFRALKIERVEIRHSNTLSWLLDPAESHGLGDIFLRRIMSNMLLGTNIGVSAAQVELMTFGDVEVRREWRNIDLLVIDRGNKLVLLVENKIGSGEGQGQLLHYRKIVSQEFPAFKILPVFLTLEGQISRDEDAKDFILYSHSQVCGVLEGILEQRRAQMPETVATFLDQYLETLRRLTMQDEELASLCRTIYRRHREAIDLIAEYGMTSVFNEVATGAVENKGDCEILYSAPKQVWFLPKSWAEVVPENGTAWKHLKRSVSICCWVSQARQARVIFEVSEMDDPNLRMACVNALQDAGFKLTKMAFSNEARYSRFFNFSAMVSDWTDREDLTEAIGKVFGKAREQFPKVEAVLKMVFKNNQ
jgi:hypothetical protein